MGRRTYIKTGTTFPLISINLDFVLTYYLRKIRGKGNRNRNWGRFPFTKNSGLKFRKLHVLNRTVDSTGFASSVCEFNSFILREYKGFVWELMKRHEYIRIS